MLRHGHKAGYRTSPTYSCWAAMRNRCLNPRGEHYDRYGGRGILVCSRWRKFENFLEDMGERPSPSHSIDRIDTEGNYEPSNCRWADPKEQRRNQSRNRAVVRDDGLRFRTMVEAAEQTGANRRCIRDVCIGRQRTHLGFTWSFVE